MNSGIAAARLGIVAQLTRRLDDAKIAYCHWKSNEHLLAAVAGDTDIDVLFDPSAKPRVEDALAAAGYWPCQAVWRRRYPDIEDHLGVDPDTGKLVHVHAHFRLVLGEEAVKSFHLPWESEMLESRHWDAEAGFYAAEPSRELLLLMVRSAIKQRYPSPRKRLLDSRADGTRMDEQREFAWLKERVSLTALKEVALDLLGPRVLPAMEVIYARGPGPAEVRLLFEACDAMSQFRRRGPLAILIARWIRWTIELGALVARRLGLRSRLSRRRLIEGGLVVAVLGADGSGKSSLVGSLDRALSRKTDVMSLYLGSGIGSSGLLRWPLVQLKRLRARRRRRGFASSRLQAGAAPAPRKGFLSTLDILWAVSLALERRAKLRKAQRARRAGMIVITDRYPQGQIPGYNDGPLLGFLASNPLALLRKLGAWEHSQYRADRLPQPDLVLKLVGTPAVLGLRRVDMSMEEISRKQDGIRRLSFDARVRVVHVDADDSADRVLANAMMEIGAELAARSRLWKRTDGEVTSVTIPQVRL